MWKSRNGGSRLGGLPGWSPDDATLTDVARMMAENHVHCIAVMGIAQDHSGELLVWGIISDLDLVRAGIRGGGLERAAALAQQPIISVKPTMALREVGESMLTHRVSHVVVIDPERVRVDQHLAQLRRVAT